MHSSAVERIPDPLTLARYLHGWAERHERRGGLVDGRDLAGARALADEALDLDALWYDAHSTLMCAFWKVTWLVLRQRAARFLRAAPSRRKRLSSRILAQTDRRALSPSSVPPAIPASLDTSSLALGW